MKTQREIADECGVSMKDVKSAYAAAERITIPYQVIIDPKDGREQYTTTEDSVWWFVNSDRGIAYGDKSDRFSEAFSSARTRWEAVEKAVSAGYRADRNDFFPCSGEQDGQE